MLVQLCIATKNPGKLKEIQELLSGLAVECVDLSSFQGLGLPEETGKTFEENTLLKAGYVGKSTGLWTLTDDSGLEVDALGGRPGIYSARYAGPRANDTDNFYKLLEELRGVPASKRKARFVCAMALYRPKQKPFICRGVLEGHITEAPRGRGGFGYDPVFQPKGFDKTLAELGTAVKNRISHRAKALKKIRVHLKRLF